MLLKFVIRKKDDGHFLTSAAILDIAKVMLRNLIHIVLWELKSNAYTYFMTIPYL